MPRVRWVLSYGSCSKFYTLSSSAKILKIDYDLTKLETGLKVGRFFETQCIVSLCVEYDFALWAREHGPPTKSATAFI